MSDISIEMKIWLSKEVVEMVMRREDKAKCCEQSQEETKLGTWSRVFRGLRLFHGSGQESNLAHLNPLAAAEASQSAYHTRNFTLELELLRAKALAQWDRLDRNRV